MVNLSVESSRGGRLVLGKIKSEKIVDVVDSNDVLEVIKVGVGILGIEF